MLPSKLFFFVALLLPYLAYAKDDDEDDEGEGEGGDGPVGVTAAFTDPLSGITFQRFFGAKTQFAFGIALPETPTTDFIGQMTFPTPAGNGWGGIALQGEMVGPLLLAAWPNEGEVVTTFRLAREEEESPPVLAGKFSVKEISQGTEINATHMQYTFLCQNCLDAKLGFTAADTAGDFVMGWALASRSVSNKADPAANMPFHDSGFNAFNAQLALAKSPEFATWAAMAGATAGATAGEKTAPVAAVPEKKPVGTTLVPVASPAPAAKAGEAKNGATAKKGKAEKEDDD